MESSARSALLVRRVKSWSDTVDVQCYLHSSLCCAIIHLEHHADIVVMLDAAQRQRQKKEFQMHSLFRNTRAVC
jgi:hypothetical protein